MSGLEPASSSGAGSKAAGKMAWARQLAKDVVFCLGIALVLTLLFKPIFDVPLKALHWVFLSNATISLGIGLTCASSYRWAFPAFVAKWPGRLAQLLFHAVVVVASSAIGTELAVRFLGSSLFPGIGAQRMHVFQVGVVVTSVVVLVSLAYEGLAAHAKRLELDAERARQQALAAQLDALQARTDPHFLFNSLNTVAGLIRDDPVKAEKVLELLSSLFRYSLTGSRADRVPLARELEAVRDYLEVQQIRFGDRLRFEIDVQSESSSLDVPPLVLLPLVENAVMHGIAPRVEGGAIRVDSRRRDESVVLRVEDDGPGAGKSPHRGSGTSLEDLEERLRIAYGGRATVSHGDRPRGGFVVELVLPAGDRT